MALNHRPVFVDKKVIICALCFIQFVVYSMRNPVVYRTAKKGGILLTICIGNSMICSDICHKYHLLTARCQIKAFK